MWFFISSLAILIIPFRGLLTDYLSFNPQSMLLILGSLFVFADLCQQKTNDLFMHFFISLAFLTAVAFSAIFAIYPDVSTRYIISLSIYMTTFWLVYFGAKMIDEIKRIQRIYIFMAVLASFAALIEWFLMVMSGDLWSVSGFFEARSEFTFVIIPAFTLILSRFLFVRHGLLGSAVLVVLFLGALILSLGRTGLFLTAFGAVLLIIGGFRILVPGRIFVIIFSCAAVIGLISAFNPDFFLFAAERYLYSLFYQIEGSYGSAGIREQLADAAINLFLDNPITGIGPENFKWISNDVIASPVTAIDNIQPHSTYLGLLAETGIFGFVFFILFHVHLLFRGWKAMSQTKRYALEIRTLIVCYILILLNISVFDASNHIVIWLFAGLLASVCRIARNHNP